MVSMTMRSAASRSMSNALPHGRPRAASVAARAATPSRRDTLLGGSAVLAGLVGARGAAADPSNAEMVAARKARIAAKKAEAAGGSAGGGAAESMEAGKSSNKDDGGVSRAQKLAAAKKERLAALREKASKIAEGEAPSF